MRSSERERAARHLEDGDEDGEEANVERDELEAGLGLPGGEAGEEEEEEEESDTGRYMDMDMEMQGDCMHAPGEEEDEVGEALREELHAGEDAEEAVGVGRLGEAERGQQQLDGEDENALDGSTGGASLDERLAPCTRRGIVRAGENR